MNMVEYLKEKGKSKIQESIAEYAFLKELLIDGVRNKQNIILSRSDFDAFGFDILAQIEGEESMYKIQLKAYNGKASSWDIHKSLIKDEFGTVVVIKLYEVKKQLKFDFKVLNNAKRDEILKQPPKKKHIKKCKIQMGDLIKVESNELIEKILKQY